MVRVTELLDTVLELQKLSYQTPSKRVNFILSNI